MTEVVVRYFSRKGPENTDATVRIAVGRAVELGVGHLVVATCGGGTALKVEEEARASGFAGSLVAVTHHVGFTGANLDDMGAEMRQTLVARGFTLVTASHVLSGLERSFRNRFQGIYPLEMVASTLRLFSQGVKTCVECAVMAADAGAVPAGVDSVFVAGTGEGADTACVISPSHANDFLKLSVREILAMPR